VAGLTLVDPHPVVNFADLCPQTRMESANYDPSLSASEAPSPLGYGSSVPPTADHRRDRRRGRGPRSGGT